jgi:transcriptional regulator with XRE-family HTH domain
MPAATKPPLSEAAAGFGSRVREFRQSASLTQEGLADRSGIHWSYIGKVERGQVNLTLHNMVRLARALETDLADLVQGLDQAQL